jgi:hypothetical protein
VLSTGSILIIRRTGGRRFCKSQGGAICFVIP